MNTDAFAPLLEAFRKALVDDITESLIERLPALQGQEDESLIRYSPEETCKLFHPQISKSTLHEWNRKGHIKGRKIGGRMWYYKSDIMAAGTKLKKYQRAI